MSLVGRCLQTKEGIGVSCRSVPTNNRWGLVSPVGWCLQTFVTSVGWCLQINKNKFLWFSPERVSTLNIVSSGLLYLCDCIIMVYEC
jgi:hypothetical protein